ncbi:hypothetical protein F5Y14DRAFT_136494 [Nemania sp. NC0429]|nr:hypothetical protein F5Y14DRAFT_136494 [Nemania sp. NC0429]
MSHRRMGERENWENWENWESGRAGESHSPTFPWAILPFHPSIISSCVIALMTHGSLIDGLRTWHHTKAPRPPESECCPVHARQSAQLLVPCTSSTNGIGIWGFPIRKNRKHGKIVDRHRMSKMQSHSSFRVTGNECLVLDEIAANSVVCSQLLAKMVKDLR